MSVNLSDSRYTLLAASHDVTPVPSAAGVTLPGGAFAVYGANLESGIADVVADSDARPEISVEGGVITVTSAHTHATVHNMAGMLMPAGAPVAPGIYIVTVDGTPVKVAVR